MASSSNPFRKQTTQHKENRFPPIDAIDSPVLPLPKTSLRDESPSPILHTIDTKRANKVIKKVRVLSPPPRSPDAPGWPAGIPPPSDFFSLNAHAAPQTQDPFSPVVSDDSDWEHVAATTTPPPPPQHRPGHPQTQTVIKTMHVQSTVQIPANPFSKKPQDVGNSRNLKEDMREEGETLKAAHSGRKSLNVDSFQRLLMTGATSPPNSPPQGDASSTAAATVPAGPKTETASDVTNTAQTSREKKAPPPPPSSRHGKSIKIEQKPSSEAAPSVKEEPAPEVAEHYRPEPVLGSGSESSESESTPESVEPVVQPELNPPLTLALEQHIPPSPVVSSKKPVPAPPPRRGHARAESKLAGISTPTRTRSSSNPLDTDPPSRSSLDSNLSRPSSIRQSGNIPAPPPPRRQPPAAKSTGTSTPQSEQAQPFKPSEISIKPMAPPPPPTRNASVRRPLSIHGVEAASRRTSAESKLRESIAPPPPPSRLRGSSQGSMDGPIGRSSMDSTSRSRTSIEGRSGLGDLSMTPVEPAGIGKSVDILADLDALQREVEALRGKMG